jgi:hypothetical protein
MAVAVPQIYVIGLLWVRVQHTPQAIQVVVQALHHRVLYQDLLAAQRLPKIKCRNTSTEHGVLLQYIRAVEFLGLTVRAHRIQDVEYLTVVHLMTAQQITVHGRLVVAQLLEAQARVLEQLQRTHIH